MIFDLEEVEQGTWFTFFESRVDPQTGDIIYDDPLPDGAEFCIRSITPILEEIQGKKKRESKMVLNPKSRTMERVSFFPDSTPEEALKEKGDIWDYAITGIKKAFYPDGRPIERSRENILKLMKIPVFDRFLAKCIQTLSERGIAQKGEEEKNSVPGSVG